MSAIFACCCVNSQSVAEVSFRVSFFVAVTLITQSFDFNLFSLAKHFEKDKLGTHLAEQEVNPCLLHCEGALLPVVRHGLAHIQRPLLPTFDYTTLSD